jgi:hypothetical protein
VCREVEGHALVGPAKGTQGVVLSVVGGGVYALVALGRSPVGKEGSWS